MITYEWIISQLETKPYVGDASNVVVTVHWRLQGTDGTHSSDVYGSVSTKPYGPGEPFIPYDQLTKEIVVGWVEEALGEETIQSYKNSIDSQIQDLANPPTITPPLPWI